MIQRDVDALTGAARDGISIDPDSMEPDSNATITLISVTGAEGTAV